LVRGAVGTGVDGTGAAIGAITDSLMMSSSSATSAFRVGGWDYPYGYYGYDYYPYDYYGYGGYGYYDDPGYGYHYGSRSRNLQSLRSRRQARATAFGICLVRVSRSPSKSDIGGAVSCIARLSIA